ncbi:MAG TPA: hypothetical protein PKK23_19215 [Nitrospirales bacterium]|nr:hypothetical protein [Nitrospirales bacterium]
MIRKTSDAFFNPWDILIAAMPLWRHMGTGSHPKVVNDSSGHEVIRVDVQDALTFFPGLSIPSIGY